MEKITVKKRSMFYQCYLTKKITEKSFSIIQVQANNLVEHYAS